MEVGTAVLSETLIGLTLNGLQRHQDAQVRAEAVELRKFSSGLGMRNGNRKGRRSPARRREKAKNKEVEVKRLMNRDGSGC